MFLDRRSVPPLGDGDEAARDGEGPPPSGSVDPDPPADRNFVAFATHVRPWRPADVPPDPACARWRRRRAGRGGAGRRAVSVAADSFPATRRLRVFAFDPAVGRAEGSLATARVAFEPLEPGPKGRLFEVVDDGAARASPATPAAALDLDHPGELASDGRAPSVGDRLFHRQMVYAVAMRTWQSFRAALGRDPVWGFEPRGGGGAAEDTEGRAAGRADPRAPFRLRLRLLADEEPEANAWYDPARGEIAFGSFPADEACAGRNMPGGRVHTCLSHDIVAHETAHALLDGMRPGFLTATNPDVPAFHEALADLAALFQHFTYPEVVAAAMARGEGGGGDADRSVALDPLLATLARQFGQGGGRPLGLRTALEFLPAPEDEASALLVRGERGTAAGRAAAGPFHLRTPRDSEEPHLRGAVLVAAVFEAFAVVLERRVRPYRRLVDRYRPGPGGGADPDLAKLVAEQACRVARQFLSLCVRAVDYCPPVDITFGDYLRALVTADADLVPDDEAGYRDALIDAFARRRIFPGRGEVANLSEDELVWKAPRDAAPAIGELHFARLRFAGDPGRAPTAGELRRQARAVFAYAVRGLDPGTGARLPPGRNDAAGSSGHYAECGLWPWTPAEWPEGDEVERPQVASVRAARRIGPNREVRFGLVAEVVQNRWHRLPDGRRARFPGGATIILGPEGEVRYIVRKGVVRQDPVSEARRMGEFAAWMASGAAAGHWAAAGDDPGGRRLDAARDALRRLHGRRHAAGPGE